MRGVKMPSINKKHHMTNVSIHLRLTALVVLCLSVASCRMQEKSESQPVTRTLTPYTEFLAQPHATAKEFPTLFE